MRPTVSLTFDDGMVCHLDLVLPILNRRQIPGTFFLCSGSKDNPIIREGEWHEAIRFGHEIGSHSITHSKAATLDRVACNREAGLSKIALEMKFHTTVESFCYPYTDAPPLLQAPVSTTYKQARGGRVARPDKFYVPGEGINFANVTCFHVGPYSAGDAPKWAEETKRRGAWLTLMLHGVGDPQAWDNITLREFETLLDAFDAEGVQFKTFAQGANIYRGGQ